MVDPKSASTVSALIRQVPSTRYHDDIIHMRNIVVCGFPYDHHSGLIWPVFGFSSFRYDFVD